MLKLKNTTKNPIDVYWTCFTLHFKRLEPNEEIGRGDELSSNETIHIFSEEGSVFIASFPGKKDWEVRTTGNLSIETYRDHVYPDPSRIEITTK